MGALTRGNDNHHFGNISEGGNTQSHPDRRWILEALHNKWPWIEQLFADGAYDRRQLMDKAAFFDFTLDIVKRTEAAFVVLPRRWVVERTLGWMTRHRRLVLDYEARIDTSEAMIDMAMGGLLIRRIVHPLLSKGLLYQATEMLTHSRRVTPHERRRAFALASSQDL